MIDTSTSTAFTVLLAVGTGTVNCQLPVREHVQLQADMKVSWVLCSTLLGPVGKQHTA